MAESGNENEDVIRLGAPLMQWAGVEPGVSHETQGSIPLLLVSLMSSDTSIQNICLHHEQGHEVVMTTLAAMAMQGCDWANKVLAVLQQATEQGIFGETDDDDASDTDEAEGGQTPEESGDEPYDPSEPQYNFPDAEEDDAEEPEHL